VSNPSKANCDDDDHYNKEILDEIIFIHMDCSFTAGQFYDFGHCPKFEVYRAIWIIRTN
jgi:hypothetical protein